MEQKQEIEVVDREASNALNKTDVEATETMPVPVMNQYGVANDPNSKCKPKHVGIGIFVGVLIAAVIVILAVVVWWEVKDFSDFEEDDRFFMCQPASKAKVVQKGGECLSVTFNVNEITGFNMQAYSNEITFVNDRKTFVGVGSKKNDLAYMAQSFHQIGGGKKDDDDKDDDEEGEEKKDDAAEKKDEENDDDKEENDDDKKGGKGKKPMRKYQIFHKALPFGGDKKVSLCDLVGKTFPLSFPLAGDPVECDIRINFEKGHIKNNDKFLAVQDDKSLIWQDEEYGDWNIYKADQASDLKYYLQDSYTKKNQADMIKKKTVFANQKGGDIECGEFDPRYKYEVKCGVLQGDCESDDSCETGLVCNTLTASKYVIIPKFHDLDNKYCQVEQCDKYAWNESKIECGTCKDGFEGKLCTAKAA